MILDDAADPLHDAVLAARLFVLAPRTFGGMSLRGGSPARDALVAALGEVIALRRLPGHVDDERLLGGIDLAASLSAGKPIRQRGLIEEAAGGALLAGMAERMDSSIAGRLVQALDDGRTALVLLDDASESDEGPPVSLTERLAFACDLSASREWRGVELAPAKSTLAQVAPLDDDALRALAATAAALGVDSLRALIFAGEAARGLAALAGHDAASKADLTGAVRLVLAPRATQLPQQDEAAPPEDQPPPPPDGERDEQQDSQQQQQELDLSDILVEAAKSAIPADLLAQLAQGNAPHRSSSSGTGQKRKAATRGKPLGARPGMPRGGAKLALIDSLRAAVPWQAVRRKEAGADAGTPSSGPIIMCKEDLRIRRFEERAARVTIFAVDASGSAAAARLAEAKGAVELMLGQAYVTRSEVALVAFRGDKAELLLPPTRSLTRARRALAELPGGGGTPLALGLNAAREVAEAVIARGRSAALGLASGFLEPLESTSIHLIQSHVSRLIQLFPRSRHAEAERAEYNRRCTAEFEQIRDFLILHYHQTAREDSEFWRYCKNMAVPDSLTQKLALFAASGRVGRDADDLFRDASWVQVMLGQGIMPADYDPMTDQIAPAQLDEFLGNLRTLITRAVASLPTHEDYLRQHCAADPATLAA